MSLGKLFEDNCDRFKLRGNPVNNLADYKNIKVLVWTIPKTGSTTLATSFQQCIHKHPHYVHVVHCHSENCWYHFHPYLKSDTFNGSKLLDYIISNGIRPLIVQSYREPITRLISNMLETYKSQLARREMNVLLLNIILYIIREIVNNNSSCYFANLYKSTFHIDFSNKDVFNRDKGYGFQQFEKYDVLFTTMESINDLPTNIKTIESLNEYHNLNIITAPNKNTTLLYRQIKDTFFIPEILVDNIYRTENFLLTFYYNPLQIQTNKNKLQTSKTFKLSYYWDEPLPDHLAKEDITDLHAVYTYFKSLKSKHIFVQL